MATVVPSTFAPTIQQVRHAPPSPLPRAVLYLLVALLASVIAWAAFGKLDIVAVSHGKLVPQSFVKIVQPAEAGIVREILVKEGDAVREGDTVVRMDTRLSDADVRAVRDELDRKRLQLRRIEAELTGTPLRRARDDASQLAAQVEAQMQARRQAYADALAAEEAVLARSASMVPASSTARLTGCRARRRSSRSNSRCCHCRFHNCAYRPSCASSASWRPLSTMRPLSITTM